MNRTGWLFVVAVGVVCLLVGMAFGGAQASYAKQKTKENPFGQGSYPKTVMYKGHMYLVVRGIHQFGITHHPDCPCRRGKK